MILDFGLAVSVFFWASESLQAQSHCVTGKFRHQTLPARYFSRSAWVAMEAESVEDVRRMRATASHFKAKKRKKKRHSKLHYVNSSAIFCWGNELCCRKCVI